MKFLFISLPVLSSENSTAHSPEPCIAVTLSFASSALLISPLYFKNSELLICGGFGAGVDAGLDCCQEFCGLELPKLSTESGSFGFGLVC